MKDRLKAAGAALGGAGVGAAAHELSHMVVPWFFEADISMGWRNGTLIGGPAVVVSATETIPDWAHAATAVSPFAVVLAYVLAAAAGLVPRRPWQLDRPADGAAVAFLVVAFPSPEDLWQLLLAVS